MDLAPFTVRLERTDEWHVQSISDDWERGWARRERQPASLELRHHHKNDSQCANKEKCTHVACTQHTNRTVRLNLNSFVLRVKLSKRADAQGERAKVGPIFQLGKIMYSLIQRGSLSYRVAYIHNRGGRTSQRVGGIPLLHRANPRQIRGLRLTRTHDSPRGAKSSSEYRVLTPPLGSALPWENFDLCAARSYEGAYERD